ncbi:hypothetical protein [Nocardia sp. BMG51109]|nr:hypothetical protein [Nocardia sp. BMG51109]
MIARASSPSITQQEENMLLPVVGSAAGLAVAALGTIAGIIIAVI